MGLFKKLFRGVKKIFSGIGKAFKGSLNNTHGATMGGHVIAAAVGIALHPPAIGTAALVTQIGIWDGSGASLSC